MALVFACACKGPDIGTAPAKNANPIAQGIKRPTELIRLAKEGDTFSQVHLAWRYDVGNGVTQDSAEAAYWYKQAAEMGHSMAQNNYGCLLRDV